MEYVEFYVKSKLDGSEQPSLFFAAEGEGKRPLIVGLHSWSCARDNYPKLLPIARRLGFALLMPEFRGPNLDTNPHCTEACASLLAREDVMESINYAVEHFDVDGDNVFIVGGSGGGHMALMMAAYAPDRFKAIASVVPISNLLHWRDQNPNYTRHVIACTGGDEEEMLKRSPISYIDEIAKANLKIFHGKWDKSVPVSQSIIFYNELIARHPSARVYLDIFDGGHEMRPSEIELFIRSQYSDGGNVAVTG